MVDVPLRVIYPGYYPALFALLAQTGVPVEPLDASIGFSDLGSESYFLYSNLHAMGKTLPWVTPATWLHSASRDILFDLARFLWQAPQALAAGHLVDRTIGDYLDLQKYSSTFADRFLIPAFAGINTVSCQEVRDYPAASIAQYFNRDFIVSSVYRAVGGAHTIAGALSQRVAQLRLRAHICSVRRQAKTVVITMEDGSAPSSIWPHRPTCTSSTCCMHNQNAASSSAVLTRRRVFRCWRVRWRRRCILRRRTTLSPDQRP